MAAEGKAFAVLYRWTVDPAHEANFRERWRAGTRLLRESHGALGSCLARAENGDFLAFARWPSETARERAFAERGPREPWPGILAFEETKLTVEEDILLGSADQPTQWGGSAAANPPLRMRRSLGRGTHNLIQYRNAFGS